MPECRKRRRGLKIPDSEAAEVRLLVAAGLTDQNLGERFGMSQHTAWAFRKKHRIPAGRRGGCGNRAWGNRGSDLTVNPPPGETSTYIDDQGRTITKCPPGFARGASPGPSVRGRGLD